RKQFFNSGWITNLANLINVNISLVLFLSHLYQLEKHQKTGLPKLDDFLPVFILDGFKIIDRCAYIFGIAAVSLFLLGHIKSATRTNFPELIAGLFWPIYLIFVNFASQTEPFFSNTKSIAAIFLLMISLAILLCPKKRKHMKKPNTILSAFSVASTPVSQCSSHWTVNHSRHLNNSSFALPEDVSSTFDLSDNRMEIDDDARTTISKSTAFSTFRERKEMRSRENTPTRDLNKKLDIMNLDGLPTPCFNDEDDFFDTRSHISTKSSLLSPKAITPSKIHVNSPFNSLTINPNVGRAQSIYGGSTFSTFSSVSKSPNFFQQSRTPSVFSQTPTT
uniref:Uncharacterized protein n=1 Tax=Panagrolaimus sp. JU765 TaxID=591449 RepID=A0AC34Q442_9BILA